MPERAWAEVIEALLTGRTQPPRKNGLTMVIDKGLGPAATADLLKMCGGVIDHWKCAFGTSAVEISDGTIPLPSHRRHNVIRCALDHGLTPITEVGKEDATH